MMTARRLFDTDSTRTNLIEAFKSGVFSSEVISYLQQHNNASIVAKLPRHTNFITLSPDILALDSAKLCSIFLALPEHVQTVNFEFANLKEEQFEQFAYLMAHSAYSKHATVFNLQWDFNHFPMARLQTGLMSDAMPQQLTNFNFKGPGSENVSVEEVQAFKDAKLNSETEVYLDRRSATLSC